jgi:hypothetical protein
MLHEELDRQWDELWQDLRRALPFVGVGTGVALLWVVGRLYLRFRVTADPCVRAQNGGTGARAESHPAKDGAGNPPDKTTR